MTSLALLESIASELKAIESGDHHSGFATEYQAGDLNCIHLHSIMVKRDAPQGIGTSYMKDLIRLADSKNLWITLDVASRGDFKRRGDEKYKSTTSTNRLKRWYSSLGFKSNSAKGLFQLKGTMHRPPNGKYPWNR